MRRTLPNNSSEVSTTAGTLPNNGSEVSKPLWNMAGTLLNKGLEVFCGHFRSFIRRCPQNTSEPLFRSVLGNDFSF